MQALRLAQLLLLLQLQQRALGDVHATHLVLQGFTWALQASRHCRTSTQQAWRDSRRLPGLAVCNWGPCMTPMITALAVSASSEYNQGPMISALAV